MKKINSVIFLFLGIIIFLGVASAQQNATTIQFIKVVSPNGGEKWEIGETYQITWKVSGFSSNDYVRVLIRKGNNDSGNAVNYGDTPANLESYRNIAILNPAGGDTSFYEVGKDYFIDISLITVSPKQNKQL